MDGLGSDLRQSWTRLRMVVAQSLAGPEQSLTSLKAEAIGRSWTLDGLGSVLV